MNAKFVKPAEAEQSFGVGRRTLKKWAADGHIRYLRPGGSGQWLFDISSVTTSANLVSAGVATAVVASTAPTTSEATSATAASVTDRSDVIYARVSTRKQTDDLERQIERLHTKYPDARVLRDVASGLNFKRKGLKTLLQLAFEGRLRHVHVAHKDRLCRFAYDLVEHILASHGATIVVDAQDEHSTAEQELAEDLLSVVTVFGARLYGKRSGQGRRGQKRNHAERQEGKEDAGASHGGDNSESNNSSSEYAAEAGGGIA